MTQNSDKTIRYPLIPVVWPWKNRDFQPLTFMEWLQSRKFSLLYLVSIWTSIALLGYGSTLRCEGTWQLAFICDQAIWIREMVTDPFQFILSFITAPFFHNGFDHIMLVSVVGFVIVVQSFEAIYGSKSAAVMFFTMVAVAGIFAGLCYNIAALFWPDHEFVNFVFTRNWMGGSGGFYGVFGALANRSKKPWVVLAFIASFETITHNVFGISLQINLMHSSAFVFGYLIWMWWLSRSARTKATSAA